MLLRLHQIDKFYATGEGPLHVLHGIDLSLEAGKSLALTGESGSGKSTLLQGSTALMPEKSTLAVPILWG